MSLTGGSSLHSLLHDIITSIVHQTDKAIYEARQAGEWEWVPTDQSFAFFNDFGPLKKLDIHRLYATEIPEVDGPAQPDDWDRSGNLASFSAGSRAALARSFSGGRHVSGNERKRGKIPSLPPVEMNRDFSNLDTGKAVDSIAFLRVMTRLRLECMDYHRYSKSKGKEYWKPTPAYTSTKSRKGDPIDTESAGILDFAGGELQRILELAENDDLSAAIAQARELQASVEEHREESRKRPVLTKPDLRRLTVNFHPAHCRAMTRALEDGLSPEVLQRISSRVSPRLGAKIEEVTGRKIVADSDHWDTKLFHKNYWHHGCERVRYLENKKEKTRVRRTAVNYNSSGGLLAHDRLRRTFARMGKDFAEYAPEKVTELKKAEARALHRQGCLPGDWEINEFADSVMEEAMRQEGLGSYIEQGFQEFLAHEILRHESGFGQKLSAREMAEKKKSLAAEIGQLQDVKDAMEVLGAADDENILTAARRVADLANRPPLEKTVERVVVREVPVIPPKLLQDYDAEIEKRESDIQRLTADLEAERSKVTQNAGLSATTDAEEIAKAVLERMEQNKDKQIWDKEGSTVDRVTAFLDYLENEPKRLMAKFRQLVAPLAKFISGYAVGEKLLKFVGIDLDRIK